jgi:hypothetical protein
MMTDFQNWWDGYFHEINGQKETAQAAWKARGELDKALAETQEPIGYVDEFGNFEFTMQIWMEEEPNVTWTPVYTTPSREWQSLSDEEIEEAVNFLNVKIDYPIMFARLIEMHLKAKNG